MVHPGVQVIVGGQLLSFDRRQDNAQLGIEAGQITRTSRYASSPQSQDVAFNPIGQVVGMMNQVQSSREVIEEMVTGYLDSIERLNVLQARAEG